MSLGGRSKKFHGVGKKGITGEENSIVGRRVPLPVRLLNHARNFGRPEPTSESNREKKTEKKKKDVHFAKSRSASAH